MPFKATDARIGHKQGPPSGGLLLLVADGSFLAFAISGSPLAGFLRPHRFCRPLGLSTE